MSYRPSTPAFAWWNTATERALRATSSTRSTPEVTRDASRKFSAQTYAPGQNGHFLKAISSQKPRLGSTLKTARIYAFTGSNTPYQSHE
jgi:hypothetical protein